MKNLLIAMILVSTFHFLSPSANAQTGKKDYFAFQCQHPSINNTNLMFTLIPSTLPAHQLRNRDGLFFASAFNSQTKKQENVFGEYSLNGTPTQLSLYYETGRIEKWKSLGNNRYKIIKDSNDRSKNGKTVQIRSIAIDPSSKGKLKAMIRDIRKTEAELMSDFIKGKLLRKFNEKLAEKLGI